MLNGLDLFSGIGGLSLALSGWVKPVAYCESDRYAQGVLLSRMRGGQLPIAPVWKDVRSLSGKDVMEQVDIICGGFPCQDISAAGAGAGLGGERSSLFFEILRLAKEIKPKFVFLENVPAIRTRGLEHVAEGFASAGYDCRWDFVSAKEVGAPHLRNRWFMLAHTSGAKLRLESGRGRRAKGEDSSVARIHGKEESLANTEGTIGSRLGPEPRRESNGLTDGSQRMEDSMREGCEPERSERSTEASRAGACSEPSRPGWWAVEPDVGRVANGVQARVDRLRGLGNAVVPLQATIAFKRLMGVE